MTIRTLLNLARVPSLIKTLELTVILSGFKGQELDIDLSQYIERFRKREDVNPSRFSMRKYGPKGMGGYSDIGIWRDTPYAFVLFNSENPEIAWDSAIGCIGFSVKRARTVHVYQIQGKKGKTSHPEVIRDIRWERMLLKIVTDWAKKVGFEQVRVQPAEENIYWSPTKQERNERLRMRYDITARRSGFTYNVGEKEYTLEL